MEHCPWFGAGLRTTMAVPMEELVHGTVAGRRRCFYDEEGNDVRLSAPGVRWNDLRKIRRDVLENLRRNCQEAFDKIYDQMVDERRVSINQHVLPVIKTPGISRKAKSCTRPAQKSSPPPSPLSPPNPTSIAAPTHTCSSVVQKIHNGVTEPVDEGFSPDHDTVNNAITKPRNNSCRSVGENGEITRLSTARETRSSARGRPPLVELSTATKRVTRSRTASNVKSKVSAQSQDTCSSVVCLAESRGGREEAEMVDFIEERVHGKSEGEREENEKGDTDAAGPDASTTDDDNMMSGDSHENMETSPTAVENEAPSPGGSGQATDGSSPGEDGSSPMEGVAATTSPTHLQSHTQTTAGFGKSPVVSLKKTKASPWAFFFHKTHFHDVPALLPTQNRPTTFFSPKKLEGAGKLPNDSALPPSFLAKSSPQQSMKAETKAARQRKLMGHMQRKKEEEEQRMRELDEKRNQEIEQRKKRNVERAQRAAERRRLDEEKKLMQHKKTQDLVNEEMSKKQLKLSLWKANERQEKSKKHNERVAAVLARKKQEEEQKAKKIQQLEEDRKMAEELHKQRLEKEEDERQARRAEKMRQEKERQQLREAEQRERQANGELPQDKPESNIIENAKNTSKPPPKHTFQQLLASTCMVTIPATSVHPNTKQDHKPHHGTATVTKSHPTLPITTHNISLEQCPPPHPITPGCGTTDKENVCPQASSDLNSTFTVDVSAEVNGKDVVVTPLKSSIHTSSPSGDSYKMTPTEPRFSNYDIDDLSSGDSTDEEDRPKKPIPTWAATAKLRDTMFSQEARVQDCTIDPCDIFPSIELLRGVDLARIFKLKRKRFYHRSSSGRWDSPVLLKKGKIDNLKMDNFSVQLV